MVQMNRPQIRQPIVILVGVVDQPVHTKVASLVAFGTGLYLLRNLYLNSQ
jgi:hypothetical protein